MDPMMLAHRGDPETSKTSAKKVSKARTPLVRRAIAELLDQRPRTGDELIAAYRNGAEAHGWPLLRDLHEVKRRCSDMHTLFRVVRPVEDALGNKVTRLSAGGSPATVWELSVPVDVAQLIVGAA